MMLIMHCNQSDNFHFQGLRPCPNWRLWLQLRLGRARLPFFNTDRRADLAVAVAKVASSDTAVHTSAQKRSM